MFDFKGIWDNFSAQVIILLCIVALFLILVGLVTQGFARAVISVFGVIFLIVLILMLSDVEKIANWLKDKIFKPNVGLIIPPKEWFIGKHLTVYEQISHVMQWLL